MWTRNFSENISIALTGDIRTPKIRSENHDRHGGMTLLHILNEVDILKVQ